MVKTTPRGSLPQRRKLATALVVCAVVGGGVATRTLLGQAPAPAATPQEFEQAVLPVLSKSCVGCHS